MAASLLSLYAFFFGAWKERRQAFRERKYVLWMVLFFAMVLTSVFISSNFKEGLRYLDPRLPLIYFPVSIGLLELQKEFKQRILLGFAWLTSFMMMLCLCWGIWRSDFLKYPEFLYNDSLTEILHQQSIYISLLVNCSIYIFTYHIIYKKNPYRIWMIIGVVFLFVISYLLASRNQMVVLYVVTIGFAAYYIFKRGKLLFGISLITALLIGTFLIFIFFPKTFNRYRELVYVQYDYQHMGKESHYNMVVAKDQWNGANFRLAAWNCGWELFRSNPLKGVDIGDKKDMLMKKYREKKFQFALLAQKNVHNNYLDILYSMGIIGLSLFIVGWIAIPLNYARKYKDGLSILIILTFASAWVTEVYFDRSLGGMLTGFFIPFLLTDKKKI